MLHDSAGKVLDLGRRRRRPNAALRRAARERDHCRCRFPGCESRRVDLHHIQYWSHGGRTQLDNLLSLCKYHHMLVHDRGYLIAAARDGTVTFCRPDGTLIPASPPLPAPEGTIEDCHDAGITAETIIPPWYGERLDLDYAIYVCFANAANAEQERQAQRHDTEPGARDRVTIYEAEDWENRIQRYYDEHAGGGVPRHRAHPRLTPDPPEPETDTAGCPASAVKTRPPETGIRAGRAARPRHSGTPALGQSGTPWCTSDLQAARIILTMSLLRYHVPGCARRSRRPGQERWLAWEALTGEFPSGCDRASRSGPIPAGTRQPLHKCRAPVRVRSPGSGG